MKITPIIPAGEGQLAISSARVRPAMLDFSGSHGPLLMSDKAMIEAATGTIFNWPPKEGEGAPQAAFDLALMRARQMAEGSVLADITATDLDTLRNAGILDEKFVSKALDYLATGSKDNDTAGRHDLRRGAAPTSGTVASDGSIYM
jgi:hypothetical protein